MSVIYGGESMGGYPMGGYPMGGSPLGGRKRKAARVHAQGAGPISGLLGAFGLGAKPRRARHVRGSGPLADIAGAFGLGGAIGPAARQGQQAYRHAIASLKARGDRHPVQTWRALKASNPGMSAVQLAQLL